MVVMLLFLFLLVCPWSVRWPLSCSLAGHEVKGISIASFQKKGESVFEQSFHSEDPDRSSPGDACFKRGSMSGQYNIGHIVVRAAVCKLYIGPVFVHKVT